MARSTTSCCRLLIFKAFVLRCRDWRAESGIYPALSEATNDPETETTGLSRAENNKLAEAIEGDVAEAFRLHSIPLLKRDDRSLEIRPVLVIKIERYRPRKEDTFNIRVETELLEAARLVKDANRIVWSPTWGVVYSAAASQRTLASTLRGAAAGYVNEFVGRYVRAHTPH
jgi:hypothetical protein